MDETSPSLGIKLHENLFLFHDQRMPGSRLWIQKAIRRPGAFRARAAALHGLTRRGTISRHFINMETHSKNPTVRREAVLARTLSRLPRRHVTGGRTHTLRHRAKSVGGRTRMFGPSHQAGTYGGHVVLGPPPFFARGRLPAASFGRAENAGGGRLTRRRVGRRAVRGCAIRNLTRIPAVLA